MGIKKRLFVILLCYVFLSSCTAGNTEEEKTTIGSDTETVSVAEGAMPKTEEKSVENKENESLEIKEENPVRETVQNFADETAAPQNTEEKPAETPSAEDAATKTVTVQITALDIFSFEKSIDFQEGMTVLDATLLAAQGTEYPVDYSGGKKNAYIKGIGGIYEKEHGAMSGWCYYVNSEKANKSCGRYAVNAGDTIKWEYCAEIK